MKLVLANNAETTLAGAVSETATSIPLAPGTGQRFPAITAGQFFPLTLVRLTNGQPEREIVYVTARSIDNVTVMRGQELTTPLTFSANDVASGRATAGCLNGKAELSGADFTGPVTLGGNQLAGAVLTNFGLAYHDAAAAANIDIAANGPVQNWTPPTGPVLLSITGWPVNGVHGELLIYGHNLGAATITLDGNPVNFINADTGSFTKSNNLSSNSGIALQTSGLDFVLIWSPDGGVTRYAKVIR